MNKKHLTRESLLKIIETDQAQCGETSDLACIVLAAIDNGISLTRNIVPEEMNIGTAMNFWGGGRGSIESFVAGYNFCRAAILRAQSAQEREQIRQEHAEWSQSTFGNVGPIGPLKHLSKEALEAAKQAVSAIDISADTVQPVHISELLTAVADEAESRSQGKEETLSLLTGIEELDAKTGGIESTDLVFIAARPSMGKTELALDIIDKVSAQGHGVLFFSMEMSDTQIAKRMVSAAGGMPMSRLKAVDKFEDEDWARFFNGMERMATRNIWITDATGLTIDQIQQTATHYQIAHPEIALVVIDYLALIKIQSAARYDLAVGEVSKGLKSLAKANKTPVLALSQLSRGVESRPNKRPMNSDMKNSGEIEADADLILMLYRDEVYNPESPAKGIAEINVTKQRNGELGTIYRRFYNGHFLPIDQEEARQRSTPQPKAHQRRYTKGSRAGHEDF